MSKRQLFPKGLIMTDIDLMLADLYAAAQQLPLAEQAAFLRCLARDLEEIVAQRLLAEARVANS